MVLRMSGKADDDPATCGISASATSAIVWNRSAGRLAIILRTVSARPAGTSEQRSSRGGGSFDSWASSFSENEDPGNGTVPVTMW